MIDILLSTYNGETYLKQQLNSILNQTFTEWRLLVRDDASSDNTLNILKLYQEQNSDKIILFPNNKNCNFGVIKSFEFLLQKSTQQYIMFCDQDDIWLPNKLQISFDEIKKLEQQHKTETPILVHSDLSLIDNNDKILHKSFWDFAGIKPSILNSNPKYLAFCNSVTGCTILMNQACKTHILPFPNNIVMHDAWIAIKVSQTGIIYPINQQLIQYRQHSNNTLGAIKYKFDFVQRIKNIKQTYNKATEVYYRYPFLFNSKLDFWFNKLKYFIIRHSL